MSSTTVCDSSARGLYNNYTLYTLTADVQRMHPVYVFIRANQLKHLLLVDMLRQWQLYQYSIHTIVFAHLSHASIDLFLSGLRRQVVSAILDTQLLTCFGLELYIHLALCHGTHQNIP
jgi:hypothetical protein